MTKLVWKEKKKKMLNFLEEKLTNFSDNETIFAEIGLPDAASGIHK